MEPPTESIVTSTNSSTEHDPKPADPKPTRAKKNMTFSDSETRFLRDHSESYFGKLISLDAVRDEFVETMNVPDTADINALRERIRKYYNNHRSYSRQKQNRDTAGNDGSSGPQQKVAKAVALQAKRPSDPFFLNRDARSDISRYFEQMKEPETVHAFDIWCEKNKETLDDLVRKDTELQKVSGNSNIGIRRTINCREWRKVSADIKHTLDEEACAINEARLAEFTRIRTPEEIEQNRAGLKNALLAILNDLIGLQGAQIGEECIFMVFAAYRQMGNVVTDSFTINTTSSVYSENTYAEDCEDSFARYAHEAFSKCAGPNNANSQTNTGPPASYEDGLPTATAQPVLRQTALSPVDEAVRNKEPTSPTVDVGSDKQMTPTVDAQGNAIPTISAHQMSNNESSGGIPSSGDPVDNNNMALGDLQEKSVPDAIAASNIVLDSPAVAAQTPETPADKRQQVNILSNCDIQANVLAANESGPSTVNPDIEDTCPVKKRGRPKKSEQTATGAQDTQPPRKRQKKDVVEQENASGRRVTRALAAKGTRTIGTRSKKQ